MLTGEKSPSGAFRGSAKKKLHEHVVVATVQFNAVIVDGCGAHELIQFHKIEAHGFPIIARDERRVGEHRVTAFHINESSRPIEIEVEFFLVEQMKDGNVMFAKAQMLNGR